MENTYIYRAADWWRDSIMSKSPEKFDNGDVEDGIMTSNVGLRLYTKPSKISVDLFENMLIEIIKLHARNGRVLELESTCKPVGVLAQIIEASGVPVTAVPWNVKMMISPMQVGVSMGYEKPYEILFEKK